MKKILLVFLLIAGILPVGLVHAENEVIEINTIEDLYNIRRHPNASFIINKDLDFLDPSSYENPNSLEYGDLNDNGTTEALIIEMTTGDGWLPIPVFKGILDGQGHTINNLIMNKSYNQAFIDRITGDVSFEKGITVERYAEIKNLGFINIQTNSYSQAAGIAIYAIGAYIHDSFVDGNISSYGNVVGGIAANTAYKTIIEDCYVTADINGIGTYSQVGGLVGVAYGELKLANNYVTSTIRGSNNVSGLLAKQLSGYGITSANNIVFSDYIEGEAMVFRAPSRVYGSDFSLFSREDIRIINKDPNGSKIDETYPGNVDLTKELYPVNLMNSANRFEGNYITYENFIDTSFYQIKEDRTILIKEQSVTGGFTDNCLYIGSKTCDQLSFNDQLFYTTSLWDFENTWEILPGADRPTLKVFNQGTPKDDGTLSKAPIEGDNITINGKKFTNGDTIRISWNQAYLVERYSREGLLYDIYYSFGVSSSKDEWILIVDDDPTLSTIDGRTFYDFLVPPTIDSSTVKFYIVASNGLEESAAIESSIIAIDNEYPVVSAITEQGTTLENHALTNQDFSLKVDDATTTTITYTLDDVNMGGASASTVFTEGGRYVFEIIDGFGNLSSFEIVLEKVSPVFNVVANESVIDSFVVSQNPITVSVTGATTLNYTLNGVDKGEFISGGSFQKDGLYVFTASDEYGNISEYNVIIDQSPVKVIIDYNESDSVFVLTGNELITKISYDGKTFTELNKTVFEVEDQYKSIYLVDTAGNISHYDLNVPESNILMITIISIGSIGILGLGTVGIILFRKGAKI